MIKQNETLSTQERLNHILDRVNKYGIRKLEKEEKKFLDSFSNNPNIGWTSGRNFRKVSYYKKICKKNNIKWEDNWNNRFTLLWDNIPEEIIKFLTDTRINDIKNLIKRKSPKKHKYIYILGKDKKETKQLMKSFYINNHDYIKLEYPKRKDS